MLSVEPFLSAYDPSDLPGGSVDPLGFDRGYTALAEQILPGLTNAAGKPRYLSVLCGAILLSDHQQTDAAAETPRQRYQRRERAVLRLERFWALACTLASQANESLDTAGIRGVRDAERLARRLREKPADVTDGEFRLLARQSQYGLLGIYASVAERLCLIERQTLNLTPSFGRQLAEAFLSETDVPAALRKAAVYGGGVKLSTLTAWGERAHIGGQFGALEGRTLREALLANDTRKRMAALLVEMPPLVTEDRVEPELSRLARIEGRIREREGHQDLYEALRAASAYERCYRICLLAFQRLLWLVSQRAGVSVGLDLAEALGDPVILGCADEVKRESADLDASLAGTSPAFRSGVERLMDAARFARSAAAAANGQEFVRCILGRHAGVQGAKRDGGRPKAAWLEIVGEVIRPTLAVAQRVDGEPKSAAEVLPHGYRTHSADAFQLREGE